MIKGIAHIGIAVNDLDESLRFYRDVLGLPLHRIEDLPAQSLRAALLSLGEVEIELLAPTAADSGLARFLERRGEGLHHIALETDDITAEMARLKQQGAEIVDEEPARGLSGLVCFIHPRAAHGVLLELEQRIE